MDKITTGKIKKFFKGKGFAGALCLSVVAIGISTYLTYDSTLKTIADEEPQKPDSTVSAEQVDNTQSGIPKDETSKSEADSSAAPANNFVRSTAKRVMPIENEVIWEYSNGELVKSETLEDPRRNGHRRIGRNGCKSRLHRQGQGDKGRSPVGHMRCDRSRRRLRNALLRA